MLGVTTGPSSAYKQTNYITKHWRLHYLVRALTEEFTFMYEVDR